MDTGGVEPWAYHTVGGVQLATHSWMTDQRMSCRRADRLPDDAVVERAVRHRRGRRIAGEVPRTAAPVADLCRTQLLGTMTKPVRSARARGRTSRTIYLVFRQGDKVDEHRHQRHARFQGQQERRRRAAARAQRAIRAAAGDAVRQQQASTTTARLLLVLQGMDTAGKGGIVKHVVGAANPQGIRYTAFGVPTEEERKHHYLWRIRRALPPAGHIGVFDRSHYEDVLVVRVHNIVPPEVWGKRYDEINRVRDEARRRRARRSSRWRCSSRSTNRRSGCPSGSSGRTKYWKYNPDDIDERLLWPAVPGGLSGAARAHVDGLRAVARRAVRPQVVQPAGHPRAADRGSRRAQLVLAASGFRRRGREEAAGQGLSHASNAERTICDGFRPIFVTFRTSGTGWPPSAPYPCARNHRGQRSARCGGRDAPDAAHEVRKASLQRLCAGGDATGCNRQSEGRMAVVAPHGHAGRKFGCGYARQSLATRSRPGRAGACPSAGAARHPHPPRSHRR